jgi:hypothetical protein
MWPTVSEHSQCYSKKGPVKEEFPKKVTSASGGIRVRRQIPEQFKELWRLPDEEPLGRTPMAIPLASVGRMMETIGSFG